MKMRVLYLQLPVVDFGYDYWGADHHLAGGYMAAYCLAHGLNHEPLFLPPKLTTFASTFAILKEMLKLDPDVVVATLYLWNIERTARLLTMLKARKPQVRLLGGGPEAVGKFARELLGGLLDLLWEGEGEMVLARVLGELRVDLQTSASQLKSVTSGLKELLPLQGLPSPYLEGIIGLAPDRSLWFETMRGCPFKCSYCYYGKSFPKVRWFPKDWVERHVLWANEVDAQEIYFLDPSFQVLPSLRERLREIAAWNKNKVRLHTEARVDRIDSVLADLFKEAGFGSMETGLQSTNAEILRKIGRALDPEAFAKGAHLLLERGVDLQIDIILGLPGDTLDSFLETVDFLVREGLSSKVNVFPLMVLPGTTLEQKAEKLGVIYTPVPPYQVEGTKGAMDLGTLRLAMEEAEKRLDQGLYPLHFPDFAARRENFDLVGVLEIPFHGDIRISIPEEVLGSLTQCPVFLFVGGEAKPQWEIVKKWARWQRDNLPDLLPFFVMQIDFPFAKEELEEILQEFHEPFSYQARLWNLCPDPYLRLSSRPFILSRCLGPEEFWLELNSIVPVIRLVREPESLRFEGDPLGILPVLWQTEATISRGILKGLMPMFKGREEELLFTRWENALSWARLTGAKLPLTRPAFGRVCLP